jgi:hypothetical protein
MIAQRQGDVSMPIEQRHDGPRGVGPGTLERQIEDIAREHELVTAMNPYELCEIFRNAERGFVRQVNVAEHDQRPRDYPHASRRA